MANDQLEEPSSGSLDGGFSMRGLFDVEGAPWPEYGRLSAAAEANGIKLDDERLEGLAEATREIQSAESRGDEVVYENQGLIYDVESNLVHFTPVTESQPFGAIEPEPQEATRIMLEGLRGMQDLVVCIDAGYLPRREELLGKTNEVMAKLAQRAGFEIDGAVADPDTGKEQVQVRGNLETVRRTVFSDEIRRLEDVLDQRLKKM